jgi:hypothetical protein
VPRGLTSGVKPVTTLNFPRDETLLTGVVGVKDLNAKCPSEGDAPPLKIPRHHVAVATGGVGPRGQADRIPRRPFEVTRPKARRKCSTREASGLDPEAVHTRREGRGLSLNRAISFDFGPQAETIHTPELTDSSQAKPVGFSCFFSKHCLAHCTNANWGRHLM